MGKGAQVKEHVVKIDDGELSLWVRANRYPYRIDIYKRKRTWYWHVMREVAGHTHEFYGGKTRLALDAVKVALLGAVAASNVEKEQWQKSNKNTSAPTAGTSSSRTPKTRRARTASRRTASSAEPTTTASSSRGSAVASNAKSRKRLPKRGGKP
jgi:hypothetical protein